MNNDFDLHPNYVIAINSSVRTRQESFGLLLASRTAPAMCLNEDAVSIWNLCDGKNTLQQIIDKLTVDLTAEDKKVVEQKIITVIKKLLGFNLLIVTNK